jgi:5-methylcytosine-specific restriction enzyme subunit McrC
MVPLVLKEHNQKENFPLTRGQAEALRTRFSHVLDVQRSWTPDLYTLASKQFVGVIELPDLRIVLQPKAPAQNLFYMLSYAYEAPEFRNYNTAFDASDDIFEFLVTIFVKNVERLVSHGIYRSYETFDRREPFLRGRLRLADHLRHSITDPRYFAQELSEFTADLPYNQILLWALHKLGRRRFQNPHLSRRIRHLQGAFADAALVQPSAHTFESLHYSRLNQHYLSHIALARLLIENMSLEGNVGENAFAAYLLNMDQIFELFVARYLEDYARRNPFAPPVRVAIQPALKLDAAGSEWARPDIVLWVGGAPRRVLDTKNKLFKGVPDEGDRRQMLEYCHHLRLNSATLIYSGINSDGVQKTYANEFVGQFPFRLEARVLDLEGTLAEFEARCNAFARALLLQAVAPVAALS